MDGTLRQPLITYDNWPPEFVASPDAPEILDGTLRQILITYSNWDVSEEEVTSPAPTILNGTLS